VEVISAIYTLAFNINLNHIANPSNYVDPVKKEAKLVAQKKKRVKTSIRSVPAYPPTRQAQIPSTHLFVGIILTSGDAVR
jgi:CRISPR/Cas system-associated protein Cas7 (RAMP superfamily)